MATLEPSTGSGVVFDEDTALRLAALVGEKPPQIGTEPAVNVIPIVPPLPEGFYSIKVVDVSDTETGPEYDVKVMMPGGNTTHSGLLLRPDLIYKARNVADDREAGEALDIDTVILQAFPVMRDGKQILLFDASRVTLPVAEYQYMAIQMVSDNQLGANYFLFHPIRTS